MTTWEVWAEDGGDPGNVLEIEAYDAQDAAELWGTDVLLLNHEEETVACVRKVGETEILRFEVEISINCHARPA